MLDDIDTDTVTPDAKLLCSSRTECISCRQHHSFAFLSQLIGKFADGRSLAASVDADHQDHQRGILTQLLFFFLIDNAGYDLGQTNLDDRRLCQIIGLHLSPQHIYDLHGGLHTDIRCDQDLLQLIHKIIVNGRLACQRITDPLRHFPKERFFFFSEHHNLVSPFFAVLRLL